MQDAIWLIPTALLKIFAWEPHLLGHHRQAVVALCNHFKQDLVQLGPDIVAIIKTNGDCL